MALTVKIFLPWGTDAIFENTALKEGLIKCALLMVRQGSPESIEGLTPKGCENTRQTFKQVYCARTCKQVCEATNGIKKLPFVLSLTKDFISILLD